MAVSDGGNFMPTQVNQCGQQDLGSCYFDNNGNCACLFLVANQACQYELDTGVFRRRLLRVRSRRPLLASPYGGGAHGQAAVQSDRRRLWPCHAVCCRRNPWPH